MRVFNVTPATDVEYRGRMISPNGGFVDVPDPLFIPERDMQLERDRILAFHTLPSWFVQKKEMESSVHRLPEITPVVVQETTTAELKVPSTIPEPSTIGADEPAPKKTRK